MIDAIKSLYHLVQLNSDWYSASFFIISTIYAVLIIGWFFSTDYYDSFVEDLDEESGFHVFICSVIGVGAFLNARLGTSDGWTIFYNTLLWALFVLPALFIFLNDLRNGIRKRRGKA